MAGPRFQRGRGSQRQHRGKGTGQGERDLLSVMPAFCTALPPFQSPFLTALHRGAAARLTERAPVKCSSRTKNDRLPCLPRRAGRLFCTCPSSISDSTFSCAEGGKSCAVNQGTAQNLLTPHAAPGGGGGGGAARGGSSAGGVCPSWSLVLHQLLADPLGRSYCLSLGSRGLALHHLGGWACGVTLTAGSCRAATEALCSWPALGPTLLWAHSKRPALASGASRCPWPAHMGLLLRPPVNFQARIFVSSSLDLCELGAQSAFRLPERKLRFEQ